MFIYFNICLNDSNVAFNLCLKDSNMFNVLIFKYMFLFVSLYVHNNKTEIFISILKQVSVNKPNHSPLVNWRGTDWERDLQKPGLSKYEITDHSQKFKCGKRD